MLLHLYACNFFHTWRQRVNCPGTIFQTQELQQKTYGSLIKHLCENKTVKSNHLAAIKTQAVVETAVSWLLKTLLTVNLDTIQATLVPKMLSRTVY